MHLFLGTVCFREVAFLSHGLVVTCAVVTLLPQVAMFLERYASLAGTISVRAWRRVCAAGDEWQKMRIFCMRK